MRKLSFLAAILAFVATGGCYIFSGYRPIYFQCGSAVEIIALEGTLSFWFEPYHVAYNTWADFWPPQLHCGRYMGEWHFLSFWFSWDFYIRPYAVWVEFPAWVASVASGCIAILIWWRSRRRQRPGHCSRCAYDLTGNTSGRCPECGLAVHANGSPVDAKTNA